MPNESRTRDARNRTTPLPVAVTPRVIFVLEAPILREAAFRWRTFATERAFALEIFFELGIRISIGTDPIMRQTLRSIARAATFNAVRWRRPPHTNSGHSVRVAHADAMPMLRESAAQCDGYCLVDPRR